jgi:hypothetical protein
MVAETTLFQLNALFSSNLCTHKFDNQAVELFIKCAALNRTLHVAMPQAYK